MGILQLNCKTNKKSLYWRKGRSFDLLCNEYLQVENGYLLSLQFYLTLPQPEANIN